MQAGRAGIYKQARLAFASRQDTDIHPAVRAEQMLAEKTGICWSARLLFASRQD